MYFDSHDFKTRYVFTKGAVPGTEYLSLFFKDLQSSSKKSDK